MIDICNMAMRTQPKFVNSWTQLLIALCKKCLCYRVSKKEWSNAIM